MVFAYSVLLNCLSVDVGMGIIFFEVYWFGVNWLKFISRSNWFISSSRVSIYFELLCASFHSSCCSFSVSLWTLIFHVKDSNFLVDILKLHGNNFLKINKFINKTFVITIVPHHINVLIDTSIVFGLPLISVSLFI